MPEDCWQTRYYVSQTAGFIHVLAANDYLGVLEKLRVPEDIARYFAYREEVILLQFARVPRSVWREVKTRFVMALEASAEARFILPFRVTYPDTDCTFMIAALDPQLPATGSEGERIRTTGLQNFTDAAMYLARTSKGVGILVSRDGEYVQIDWCLLDAPWRPHPEMDARLSKNNPFREVTETLLNSFLFDLPPGPK